MLARRDTKLPRSAGTCKQSAKGVSGLSCKRKCSRATLSTDREPVMGISSRCRMVANPYELPLAQ